MIDVLEEVVAGRSVSLIWARSTPQSAAGADAVAARVAAAKGSSASPMQIRLR
ncbi:hypothetical protein [Lysobacter capsici]|uniref:hypothetical protein n=1 Tax=Lysobacter capsici TaxID=435897 RepID=UPI00398CDF9C